MTDFAASILRRRFLENGGVAFQEKPKKLSQIKDKDEKRWRIEESVRAFERSIELKREIEEIKADKELHAAVEAVLNQKAIDLIKAQKIARSDLKKAQSAATS